MVQLPESVATAHARAPSEPVISQEPARVAEAFKAPTTSAESPQIPERVATAERISPIFASLIVPLHSIVASIFTHKAQDPAKAPSHRIPTLLQSPPDFGGSIHE
jgi:hypothetical protein